jgi:hypothetical protein
MKKKSVSKLPLAVAETVQTGTLVAVTTPPLKKAELITALVERARLKHLAEYEAWVAQKPIALAAYTAAVLADYEAHTDLYTPGACPWSPMPTISIIGSRMTPALNKLRVACEKPRPVFDLAVTKARIRDAMNGNSAGCARIQAVLNNPETVKALDATLEAIDEVSS